MKNDIQMRVESCVGMILKIEMTEALSRLECDNWDSLNHLSIMMAIEDEFGVRLSQDELVSLDSVPKIVAFLQATV